MALDYIYQSRKVPELVKAKFPDIKVDYKLPSGDQVDFYSPSLNFAIIGLDEQKHWVRTDRVNATNNLKLRYLQDRNPGLVARSFRVNMQVTTKGIE